jgi:DNA invertase Pin-like site-specific DNA recombinase/uncharacterized protein YutE (UPF0331/DUF86 family)
VYQYKLVERAEALGWSNERIRVIDSDMGLSGATSDKRDGYKTLIAEIPLGKVGIIFGYEVSRLARNNSDWYHLLDLASLFGTLIADAEGIYDPRSYNDRILLGLKGTMSEAELHLIKMRLAAGRMSQVKRGEYRQKLPAGLERLDDGTVIKDPDSQVRETVELVFKKFTEFGTCAKVMKYLAREKINLPRRHSNWRVVFRPPTSGAVLSFIKNPAYAGTFVYGRLQTEPLRGGRRFRAPIENWIHVQQGVYPAYINWQTYLDNYARIRQNYAKFCDPASKSKGVPRGGHALLQGVAICGNCGEHMKVNYNPQPRYFCDHKKKRVAGESCPSHPGTTIDEAILRAFFNAMSPAHVDALEGVIRKKREERKQSDRRWQQVLKRAEFEAQREQDRYEAVDARNRLVAETLEARWEESLSKLRGLRDDYDAFRAREDCAHLLPELREQMRDISASLPQLWLDGKISLVRMKELLRCLVDKVVLKKIGAGEVEARIVWVSGGYWSLTIAKTMHTFSDSPDYEKVVALIHKLWSRQMRDVEIAEQLNSEGFRSPRAATFLAITVQHIRLDHGWRSIPSSVASAGYLKVSELARKRGVSTPTIYRYIEKGWIPLKYIRVEWACSFIKDCDELHRRLDKHSRLLTRS